MTETKTARPSIKLALLALSALIGLVLLSKALSFIFSLNQPYSPDLADAKTYPWDTQSSYNILYATSRDEKKLSDITFINFQPREKAITVLHIPDTTYARVPRGYGEWTIGSIYQLGEEDGGVGVDLLRLSLSQLVGLPIDGIIINKNQTQKAEDAISSLRKNQLAFITLGTQIKSNISAWELITLGRFAGSVRQDKVITLDLAKSSITESRLLPDSTRVLGIDNIQLDSFIRNSLADTALADENASIAILNATNHPGLAQAASRLMTNLGATVVFTGNTESLQSKSAVVEQNGDLKFEITKKRLEEMFAPWCSKEKCTSADPKALNARAQIVVILGEDFYTYWNKR